MEKRTPAFIPHNLTRFLLALAICLLLAGCAAGPGGTHAAATGVVPATPTASADLSGWRVLYQRATPPAGATVDLRAVGDIMIGRLVGVAARKNGLDYPFTQARALLAGDLAIGNLESPLTERQAPLRPGPYRLLAAPAFAAKLHAAGFGALSLANNHALDVGPLGLRDASAALTGTGILALGAGPDRRAASTPAFVTINGLRVALLAFNDVRDPQDQASEGQADRVDGMGWGRAWLDDTALAQVRTARSAADIVIVIVHWGQEYSQTPTPRQRKWARTLIGAGADVIVGAHSHVEQPAELVTDSGRHGLVAYSLGNFIFDQAERAETSTGAVLRVLLDRSGVALAAAAPIAIVAGQARPLALESSGGLAALANLALLGTEGEGRKAENVLQPTEQSPEVYAAAIGMQAWRWDGHAATHVALPTGTSLPAPPQRIPADLRGDGQPLYAALDTRGQVALHDGAAADAPVVWRSDPGWRVTRIDAGDLDDDGRIELVLLLWRTDADGQLHSHPFMIGWRGGQYRLIWGGSATAVPMQDLAVGDLNGDGRQELVVLEGGRAPGDAGETVSIWRWNGWMFDRQWRSPRGSWHVLALQDAAGDGTLEAVVGDTP